MPPSLKTLILIQLFSLSLSAQTTLAILNFKNLKNDKTFDWMKYAITDFLTVELTAVSALQVLERMELNKIIDEQEFGNTDLIDPESAGEMGKLLGAKILVAGSFVVDKEVTITCKLIEVKTGKILFSDKETGPRDHISRQTALLAGKISGYFGEVLQPQTEISFHDFATYGRGLSAMDSSNYTSAAAAFKSLLREYPGFMPAADNLQRCYRFLKKFRQSRYQREINGLMAKIKKVRHFVSRKGYKEDFVQWMTAFDKKHPHPSPALKKKREEELKMRASCPEPTQCIWNIMMDLGELAEKYFDYFKDTSSFLACYSESIAAGEKASRDFPEGGFVKEMQYMIIMDYYMLGITLSQKKYWLEVKNRSEKFLQKWPDYRMIEAVENNYELALEKLEGG